MTDWQRRQELERIYDGPIPQDPIVLTAADHAAFAYRLSPQSDIDDVRDLARQAFKLSRAELRKGDVAMYRHYRECARVYLDRRAALARYKEAK
jgi:hypothetical protein